MIRKWLCITAAFFIMFLWAIVALSFFQRISFERHEDRPPPPGGGVRGGIVRESGLRIDRGGIEVYSIDRWDVEVYNPEPFVYEYTLRLYPSDEYPSALLPEGWMRKTGIGLLNQEYFGFSHWSIVFPFWIIPAGASVFFIRHLQRTRLIQKRSTQGLCLKCGYDKRGCSKPTCPECGHFEY